VEIAVEKKLGFNNKQQIEEYGIEKFNDLCRKSVFDYIQDWEKLTDRIAFWVDLGDAYVTYTNDYIESVWWILKSFWERDLLYKGYKIVPYCPRCGTPLSDHEVALGYRDAVDPSVFVRMPLVDKPGTSLLVWTTTPWTLPANVAVAVGPEVDYVTVERSLPETEQGGKGGTERLILAKALLEKVFRGETVKVVEHFKGKKLKGSKYHPLFTFMPLEKPAHFVILGDFVTTEDGTGLVHIAPAFGADDMEISPARADDGRPGWRFPAADHALAGCLRQGRRPVHYPGLAGTRPDVPLRKIYPYLSLLLALWHALVVLCPRFLVHPHQPVQGPLGGAQQQDQLGT
jgi:isoleucyl-tRNA synthetase